MKFLTLETERLILNLPTETDCEQICKILNNSEVYAQNTLNIPFPYTLENARFWVSLAQNGVENQTQYVFAIRAKSSGALIGGIDLGIDTRFNKAELGYWIDEQHWNQGFATEAAQAMIEFGFKQLKLKRIFASHFDSNAASGKVLVKVGMHKEGTLQCHTRKGDVYQHHVLYAIINA